MQQAKQIENLPKIIVRNSSIHGKGIFAGEDIPKKVKIIEYVGEKISGKEGDRRSELDDKLTYIFILNDKFDIDGSVNGNDSRLINHSCDPNCEIDYINDHIWIYSLRDIKKGEELTYDYAFDADELEDCHCGSKSCRGYINDPDDEITKKLLSEKESNSKNL
jgi:uncharacterized protein